MNDTPADGRVVAVARDDEHRFSKGVSSSIDVLAGIGVDGDAHAGTTVQHLSRVRRDPAAPNLRQVHLMHSELFAEVAEQGHHIQPGQLGENITTEGIDVLALPRGARLRIGEHAVLEVTGLRNPCAQIDGLSPGLMKLLVQVDEDGRTVRRAGVMSIVLRSGTVRAGDRIAIRLPAGEPEPLGPV